MPRRSVTEAARLRDMQNPPSMRVTRKNAHEAGPVVEVGESSSACNYPVHTLVKK